MLEFGFEEDVFFCLGIGVWELVIALYVTTIGYRGNTKERKLAEDD